MVPLTAPSYTEGLRLAMEAVIPLAHRHMFLANEPVDDPDLLAAYAQEEEELRASIEAAKEEGRFDRHIPTAWIAGAFNGLIYTAWEQVQAQELTPKQAATLAWQTLTKGVTA